MTVERVLALSEPSLTTTVMVVLPFLFGNGVIVTMRLAPLPVMTMFEIGTKDAFDEVAVTINDAAGVSLSFTVSEMGPSDLFSSTLKSGKFEIDGAALARGSFTVTFTICEPTPEEFVAVTVKVACPIAVMLPLTTPVVGLMVRVLGKSDAAKIVGELVAVMWYVKVEPSV